MTVNEVYRNRGRGDEFYTRYDSIASEMKNYNLAGMVVYCNADNPDSSKFVTYFRDNFKATGIAKLMATFKTERPFLYEYDGVNERRTPIRSGLFQDNIGLIRKCDIVITNPPFGGLPLKLIQLLISNGKKFIIIGPRELIQKKDIFDYVRSGQLRVGNNIVRGFDRPNGEVDNGMNAYWWTNMEVTKPNIPLNSRYDEALYPKYDNLDAIEVGKVKNIPSDYSGNMGVPISFITVFNPNQFDLVGLLGKPKINGKGLASRLIIRNKNVHGTANKARRDSFYKENSCINMKKNEIILSEQDLHFIVEGAVKRILGKFLSPWRTI